jgi:hypothetical protein
MLAQKILMLVWQVRSARSKKNTAARAFEVLYQAGPITPKAHPRQRKPGAWWIQTLPRWSASGGRKFAGKSRTNVYRPAILLPSAVVAGTIRLTDGKGKNFASLPFLYPSIFVESGVYNAY